MESTKEVTYEEIVATVNATLAEMGAIGGTGIVDGPFGPLGAIGNARLDGEEYVIRAHTDGSIARTFLSVYTPRWFGADCSAWWDGRTGLWMLCERGRTVGAATCGVAARLRDVIAMLAEMAARRRRERRGNGCRNGRAGAGRTAGTKGGRA